MRLLVGKGGASGAWTGNTLHADLSAGGYPLQIYEPLREHPGLFREFAATEPTKDGIRRFTTRFGTLGAEMDHAVWPEQELLSMWVDQIEEMRRAVELYEAIQESDGNGIAHLNRLLDWQTDERGEASVYYMGPEKKELIASNRSLQLPLVEEYTGVILERFTRGNKVIPARYFLSVVVDRDLTRLVGLVLAHDATWKPVLLGVPRNLLGALWLQFAQAYTGKELRQCLECKRWFEVHGKPRGRGRRTRSDVQYCSVACRNRAYRGHQEQARKLHAEARRSRKSTPQV